MKIGILTFHWATNYGAILQAYALQTMLEKMGHCVEIISYKPSKYDNNLWTFIRARKFIHLREYFNTISKEKQLRAFRKKYLHTTQRFTKEKSVGNVSSNYDVIITGSDQVMNPSFLKNGEPRGSTAYFLGFGDNRFKRIAYAVSFGTTDYPKDLCHRVSRLVESYAALSVRESTGVHIFNMMGRSDAIVVPDPTLLLKSEYYDKIISAPQKRKDLIFVYMLHNRTAFISSLKKGPIAGRLMFSQDESLEQWIDNIRSAQAMITNSFHGVVFCLIYHIPFVVVLKQKENVGMNDRFFTLLGRCNLLDRITTEQEYKYSMITFPIDWKMVDKAIGKFVEVGLKFLYNNI